MWGSNLRSLVLAAAAAGLCGLFSAGASATTVTFDAPTTGIYTESGYTFAGAVSANTFDQFQPQPFHTLSIFGPMMFSLGGLVAFNLDSLDFADIANSGNVVSFQIQASRIDGVPVLNSVITTDAAAGLQTLNLGLTNLSNVWLQPIGPGATFLIDNVKVSAVATTPIPGALPLLLSALAGLGGLHWRRARAEKRLAAPATA
ncbi:hypothetical protein [Dongia sedimenti]|uniref:Secreted protein n=1 Tax=Dongia sedimenti TaxID=3064282 RepID=A0ABU0YLV0_9PROT|nr:hypothetical protein [Rhodospirillaceae bacterium R-7]